MPIAAAGSTLLVGAVAVRCSGKVFCRLLARVGMGWPEQLLELLDGQEGKHLFIEI